MKKTKDILEKLDLIQPLSGVYCGSPWPSKQGMQQIQCINPATEEVFSTVNTCTADEVDAVIVRAQHAFLSWRIIPAPKRGEIVRQIAELLRKNRLSLGELISLEMGKSKQEGIGEVQEMIDMADFAVGQSRMLYGKTMHSERPCHRLYEQWHPLGVIGVITAFNFPMAVWAWNAFIALISGNTVIWKPSSKTPLCAIAVHKLCQQVLSANQCPEVLSLVIPESREISEKICADSRVNLVSFTGSSESGRRISSIVARRLGRTILELGGNNAVVIDDTAKLSLAVPAIVFGAIGTAGQRCTSTRRVFIHKSRYQEVVSALIGAYQQIHIGDPMDLKNHMGPLVDKAAVSLYQSTIDLIQANRGSILYGGEVLNRNGFYVMPTLVSNLNHSHPLVQKETFAPILYLFQFESLEEALHLQNNVPQGLSSSLFTEKQSHAELFLSVLGSDCGIANINIGTSGAEITGAFGGEKDTGGGREAGSDAWKSYMRRQTNTINWGPELPLAQGIKFKF